MVEGVFSFHNIRQACLADQPAGWYHCVRTYAPLVRQWLQHYFPGQDQTALLTQVFREARAQQAQLWRTFAGTNEKEFLLHLRRFVFEQARASRRTVPETPFTPESFWRLLEPFPLLQREMLLLSFHRYTAEALSEVTDFLPESTRAVAEQAREKLKAQLGAGVGPDFEQRDHDTLFAAIDQQRGDNCVLDKTYVRIVDGQITWRGREEADRHRENCLYCLNRFAEFREAHHFFHKLPPAGDAEVARILAGLGVELVGPPRKKRAWWQRLLGA
ncbi:MAG: hypothetical protein HY656_02835 [Acidobacteria bacterium]|nr:hypothetical protein [Acidobacteriota bacterium]